MAQRTTLKPLDDGLRTELQAIADKKSTTIISFVAPQGVRTSPVTFASASIEDAEMYRLEEIIKQATDKQATESLHFVVHTPGGEMFASYKIASFLRSRFTHISAFVPYEAASGGTILCCAANELHIGELGNLTPIDPQIRYHGHHVSCYAFLRVVDSIQGEYGEMSPEELPSPWRQMAEKLEPVIYDEMSTLVFTSVICAKRLLEKSGYPKEVAMKVANFLTRNYYSHAFPVFAKEAEEIGFIVKPNDDDMKIYGKLVSCRLQQEFSRHAIDAFFPTPPATGGISP